MNELQHRPSIENDGWTLVLVEPRKGDQATLNIPPDVERESLSPGDGAKLLFDIETKENGRTVDRGVDGMWVIVTVRSYEGYVGVLDNDPGAAENLRLQEGDMIAFGPEHIIEIGHPPREYLERKYGRSFFRP